MWIKSEYINTHTHARTYYPYIYSCNTNTHTRADSAIQMKTKGKEKFYEWIKNQLVWAKNNKAKKKWKNKTTIRKIRKQVIKNEKFLENSIRSSNGYDSSSSSITFIIVLNIYNREISSSQRHGHILLFHTTTIPPPNQ